MKAEKRDERFCRHDSHDTRGEKRWRLSRTKKRFPLQLLRYFSPTKRRRDRLRYRSALSHEALALVETLPLLARDWGVDTKTIKDGSAATTQGKATTTAARENNAIVSVGKWGRRWQRWGGDNGWATPLPPPPPLPPLLHHQHRRRRPRFSPHYGERGLPSPHSERRAVQGEAAGVRGVAAVDGKAVEDARRL